VTGRLSASGSPDPDNGRDQRRKRERCRTARLLLQGAGPTTQESHVKSPAPHPVLDPYYAEEQATHEALRDLLAQTEPATRADVEPLLGRYDHGVELVFSEQGLGLTTEFGRHALAALPAAGAFLGTGAFAGGVAVVPGDETGDSLLLGIPSEEGLEQAVTVRALR